jgi:hypothetical protein
MLNQTILFICEILQENWVLCDYNSILAYTHYMDVKQRLYVFFLFSRLHLCLRTSLSRVPMYMFFGTYFKLYNWRFSKITHVDVAYIKMVLLVLDQSFYFYQFNNLTYKYI